MFEFLIATTAIIIHYKLTALIECVTVLLEYMIGMYIP